MLEYFEYKHVDHLAKRLLCICVEDSNINHNTFMYPFHFNFLLALE